MKRLFLLLAAIAAFAGCRATDEKAAAEPKTDAGQLQTGIIDASTPEAYQQSLEKLRHQLTDDRQLYEFVAAVGLVRSGAESAEAFRTLMDGRSPADVVEMAKKNGLDYLAASYAGRTKAAEMRKGLVTLAGESNVKQPVRGEVVTVDPEHLYPSLAAMAISVDDVTLFRLTAALDVLMAMSLDQLDYVKKISGRSAAELIAAGRAEAFEAAVRKSMYTIPAGLLRGELDESAEPENTLRFDCAGEAVQSASLGRILASLDNTGTLKLMTAINMLRSRCQDEKKFNSILDKRSARELVNRMYRENPAEFIQEYGTLRLAYSDTDLAAIRAKYVAFSAVAAAAPASELQPPPQPKDAADNQPVEKNPKQEQPAK